MQLSLFDLFDEDYAPAPVQQPKPNRDKRPYTDGQKPWYRQGAMVLFEGQLGTLKGNMFVPMKGKSLDNERAKEYLPVRDTYFELVEAESGTRTEQAELRKRLNSLYDKYVAKWGMFHTNGNKAFILSDSLGMEVLAIEMLTEGKTAKADIMREPVAFKKIDTSVTLTPSEALAGSLNYFGRVNMDYLVQTTRQDETAVIEALQDEMYYNAANGQWEHKGKFIAGNVIAKSKDIRTAIAEMDEGAMKGYAKRAAVVLEAAIPEAIPYEELDFNLGERWVPTAIYADFAKWLFQVDTDVQYIDVNDSYIVNPRGYSPVVCHTYSVRNLNGAELLVYAMHDTVPELTKEAWRGCEKVRVPDEEAIQEASNKIQDIRRKFNEWLDSQPIAVRDELVRLYNERFNCYVRPSYDGSMQTFPGLSFEQFAYNDLYPSQKDAIQMIKQNGGGVCWHEMGAGKTMVMCVAAYEMKRIGLIRKPLIIGLKANVHEIADTFRKAYPTARLLYPGKEDFTPANRQEMFAKIKNNNWDCIILTHDQFGKIPQSDDTMMRIYMQELHDVERSLDVLEQTSGRGASGRMLTGLEKRKENLKAKLDGLESRIKERKDEAVDFHTMGIDHIFIDECHQFKNLMFQTRHTRVAGIGNTQGSQRAMNLLVAIRDIQMRTGRDLGASFFSGTVIVNALTELYVLFKYLRPQELQRQRVSCFDAWAAIFTKKATDYELGVTGSIRRKERFRCYIKVPELAAFLREITDYRTAEMINLDVPDKNVRFLSSAPTAEQETMIKRLVQFANSGDWADLGLDTPAPENLDKSKMLVATDIARKMALDMRLLGSKFSDDPANKASICARTIYEYYTSSAANKGTQFVFSDLSTYKPNEWNIYSDMKAKLVELGIPASEIQFIQTAKSERSRKRMIEDMNNGNVRVLFGSTTMLGTGVNAQKRAVAVHHLDIPWRPADLEQRNGRAVRKGNGVKLWGGNKVDVIIYGTEQTLDAYKFNLLRNKQMFINQINNGTIAVRRIDEDSMDEQNGMNFAEFVAILSGNTDLLNKAKLDSKIMQLEKEQAAHNKERYRAEHKIEQNRSDIEQAKHNRERLEADRQYAATYEGERITSIADMPQATAKEIGQRLHLIAKQHRGGEHKVIGSYMGLNLTVRSEYNFAGAFDRNSFFVEGKSGLRYRLGNSGALPPGHIESAACPQAVIERLPQLIASQQERIDRLTAELPTLQAIVDRKWDKTGELAALKAECKALQERIDAALKAAEEQGKPKEMPSEKPQAA